MKAGPAPETNRVVACLGGEETALETRPAPKPGAGEILLGLRVVGFCGTDLFKLVTGSAAKGTVLGHEVVGHVIATGYGVDKFSIGDRVVVPHHVPCGECLLCRRGNETMCDVFRENLMEPGAFADVILIRPRAVEHAAYRLPDHLSDEAAVFMEPAGCVLRGIRRAELPGDASAVVLGAGSMGLLHLLVLKAALPGITVTVIDPVAERRGLAGELGADHTAAPGAEALDTVQAATGGFGADAAFDTVGGSGTLEDGLRLTRQGGAVVLFAHAPADDRAGVDLNSVFKFERRIIGTYSASVKEQSEIFDLLESGALDPSPLVTHTMPLDDFTRGVALVKNHQALKVLFTPSQEAL
ncbi:MAG: alcohol dehydrogenase catalytic domain-containing protein [Rhodospirillales bacterium]|nr:alcohol dehydrogenase catalytic domain-containing protein [Alphaproteobacteria bacterium]MBL6947626.1 alcohol dehydrogenase catalytic domain-containing protein [Rhodospirillales bacterium]